MWLLRAHSYLFIQKAGGMVVVVVAGERVVVGTRTSSSEPERTWLATAATRTSTKAQARSRPIGEGMLP